MANSAITTILQVQDGRAAVEFYRDLLGLHHLGTNSEGQELFSVGTGSTLALMPSPEAKPTGNTEVSFEVTDIVAEIGELRQRGVRFADYDLPGLKTVEHVCVLGSQKAAWFEDPTGNVLCLHEVVDQG